MMVHWARSYCLFNCHALKWKEKLIRTSLTLLSSVLIKTASPIFLQGICRPVHWSTSLLYVSVRCHWLFTFADFNFGKSCHIWFLAIVLVLCVRLVRNCCCCCCLSLLGFCFCFYIASASGFIAFVFLCPATPSLMAFPLALVQIGFNRGLLWQSLLLLFLSPCLLRLCLCFCLLLVWMKMWCKRKNCDCIKVCRMCVCVCEKCGKFKWSCYCKLKWFELEKIRNSESKNTR